jgi:plasmid stabilization system protein ParE
MPTSKWSNKDERKYEHIKDSARERGASEKRAKSIAGATVNKQRRKQGRTPNKTTQGTGNPNRPLAERSRQEVYNRARQLDIPGRSKMSKQELVRAVEKHR